MKSEDILEDFIKRSQEDLEIQPRMSSFGKTLEKLDRAKRKRRWGFIYFFSGLLLISLIAYTFKPAKVADVQSRAIVTTANTKAPV
jgi:hypothetical protein